MEPSGRVLAVIGLVCAGAFVAHACSSGAYLDPKLGFMSWRLYDQPASWFNSMAFVPAGTKMQLLPVTGRKYSSLGSTIRTRNNVVCVAPTQTVIEILIAASEPGVRMDSQYWPGGCLEGYNQRGLHVSVLMQDSSTGINRYSGKGPAVEQVDMPAYILGQYGDVASVVADLENGKLNPVINPSFEIITKLMFNSTFSTVHYNIRDNSGRSVVVEYSGPNNLQWHENGADTQWQGALANNPLWEEQTAYYNNYWATYNDPYVTMHGSSFVNLPGSFNSSHRFARAARLPQAGYTFEWPKFIEISPYYPPEGAPATNPAVIAAMNILQSMYLPKGIDDAGGEFLVPNGTKKRDIVWMSFIADHKLNYYYYRVASSPQWKRIALNDVHWSSMGNCIKRMKTRASVWWVDESNSYARSRSDELRNHQELPMTFTALKEAIAWVKDQAQGQSVSAAAATEASEPAAAAATAAVEEVPQAEVVPDQVAATSAAAVPEGAAAPRRLPRPHPE